MRLREYQIPHADKQISVLKKRSAVLDGSDAGTGKTYVAAHIAKAMKLIPVVVCPKNVRNEWADVLNAFGHEKVFISNYEQYKVFNNTEFVSATKKKRHPYRWLTDKRHLIIFDEVHVCKDPTSLNSKLLLATKMTGSKIMLLSATVADNPLQLEAVGAMLGLFHDRPGYYDYCFSRGVIRDPSGFGLLFRGRKEDLIKIHNDLYIKKGARMLKSEIPGFPKEQVIPKLYSIEDSEKVNILYDDVKKLTERIEQKKKFDKSNVLTERLRKKQEIEALRLPIIMEETKIQIEQGKSVIIFVNYKDSISYLLTKMKKLNPVCIHGDVKEHERENAKKLFQADKVRVIIVQTQAGVGIGLHDMNGNHPRVSFICPTDSAINLIQNMGRPARNGALTDVIHYIAYIAGTIEETVYKNVRAKADRIKLINDGDLKC